MNQYVQRAERLRTDPSVHYNCAQAVLVAYAPECGISQEKAMQLGAHFGGGMKMASVCGAITGALMVIGMLGGGDGEYRAFMNAMRANHEGMVNCADLLKKNAGTGRSKAEHCDGMVYEAVEQVSAVMHLA